VTDRREFIKVAAAAGGAVTLGLRPELAGGTVARAERSQERPGRALRILVLGGTSFIGPPLVDYALERGHQVTLFNRGRTNPGLFPGVEKLVGDRTGDLSALEGRTWDVVFDNAASDPRWLERSNEVLKDATEHYVYVSSISAYADMAAVPMTSAHPTFTYETAGVEVGAERLPYGLAKAESERRAQEAFPGRCTVVRPGLIVGPRDDTDRFTYWPARIHRGGEVLAPSDGSDPCQVIDARDLSEWMVRLAENGTTGVFNGLGPAVPWRIDQMLYGIRAVTTAETTFTWVDVASLREMGVRPWQDMPAWMPPEGDQTGASRFDLTPEVESGLTFRPLATTAEDTLEYHLSRPAERQANLRFGLTPEREAEALAAWHSRGP
jgi:2'-hydroxyisoflavone reductase